MSLKSDATEDAKRRRKSVLDRYNGGESVDSISKDLNVWPARIYQMLKKARETEKQDQREPEA